MIKVCFICAGNTCRSIMAERLMKKVLKDRKISDVKISSKGIKANGENIAPNAKFALKKFKALSSDRKSVKLKKIDKSTLYVVMSETMKVYLDGGKVISMKSLIGKDIQDPYGYDEQTYIETANQILDGIEKLIEKIINWREK